MAGSRGGWPQRHAPARCREMDRCAHAAALRTSTMCTAVWPHTFHDANGRSPRRWLAAIMPARLTGSLPRIGTHNSLPPLTGRRPSCLAVTLWPSRSSASPSWPRLRPAPERAGRRRGQEHLHREGLCPGIGARHIERFSVQLRHCPHAEGPGLMRLRGTSFCGIGVASVHDWGRVVRAVWLWYSTVRALWCRHSRTGLGVTPAPRCLVTGPRGTAP